jgi:glyceraldehyde 3-phosphate dehydrogenase
MIYSLSFDSVHGKFNKKISKEGNILKIENILIRVFNEKDCEKIGWGSVGADYICESSGVFLTKEKVKKHLEGGGKKVIISAPAKDDS